MQDTGCADRRRAERSERSKLDKRGKLDKRVYRVKYGDRGELASAGRASGRRATNSRATVVAMAALLAATGTARAGSVFTIGDRTSDYSSASSPYRPVYDAMMKAADQLEATVNNQMLTQTSRQNLLDGVARAGSSVGAGLGVDYVSDPSIFVIGGGLNIVGNGGSATGAAGSTNSIPAIGVGAQASLMVGMPAKLLGISKLGPLNGDRLMLYVNGMSYSTKAGGVKIGTSGFGMHAKYSLYQPRGSKFLAEWGGLNVTSGIDYSTLDLSYGSTMNVAQTEDVGGQTVKLAWATDYDIGLQNTTITIPLDVSTSFSLLYIASVYVSGGVDFNFGSSTFTGGANGPVTATYSGSTGGNLFSGNAKLALDDGSTGGSSTAVLRMVAGAQFNLWVARLYAQFLTMSNGNKGVGFGLKVSL